MKKQRQHSHSKVFQSYVISYISVVLVALSLLSIVAAQKIANGMRAEEMKVTESKLYSVMGDLDNQLEEMRNTALKIAASEEFQWDYFQSSKYLEVDMLSMLEKYRQTSSISDYYFLKYQKNDKIFTSGRTTMPLNVYLEQKMNKNDAADAEEKINTLCGERNQSLALLKVDETTTLFIYPLKNYAVNKIGMEGVLCFEVSKRNMAERIEKIVGRINGSYVLYYDENVIGGQEAEPREGSLEKRSRDGKIRLIFYPEKSEYFLMENVFSNREWVIFGGITLLMLVLAIFAAYRSYQPIHRLVEKYKKASDSSLSYDLESIDRMLDALLRKEETNSKLLQKQYQALREQTIRLIVSGGYFKEIRERLGMLNLHLDTPVFSRVQCSFGAETEDLKTEGKIHQDIEDLSDEGVWLYSTWKDEKLIVLVAMQEEYQAEEAVESLQSLFEAKNLETEIELLNVCHDLKQIHHLPEVKKNEAESAQEIPQKVFEDKEKEREKLPEKQNMTVVKALRYIEENFTEYDLSLDLIAKECHVTPTYMSRLLKQQTQMSYKDYLTKLRMEEAKRLFRQEEIAVADVCQRTGYTNVSHFIRVFQKYTGVTPAKYRDGKEE